VLVDELLGNLHFEEQRLAVELVRGTRLLVFPRLLQIGAVAGTIERDLALLAAALGANAAVYGRTEALFLANPANRAAQIGVLLSSIMALDAGNVRRQFAIGAEPLTSRANFGVWRVRQSFERPGANRQVLAANCRRITRVCCISGFSSANKHVEMAIFECYLCKTRVK
jgi:hypothetical protein